MTSFKYFSKNSEVRPIEEAVIPLGNIEYSYGFGVYETIRVNKDIPFFLNQHISRLIDSASTVGIEHPFTFNTIRESIESLVKALEPDTYNLKVLLIGGNTKDDALMYILPSNPLFPDRELLKNGVSVITINFERLFPTAKTLNMLQSYLAYKAAKQNGCYDALGIDEDGFIREGTRTNFLAVKGNVIYNPPKDKILDGVTQRVVLSVASKNGYEIKENDISKEDLINFDGFFLTSTSSKVMPISKIDNISFSIPENTRRLMSLVDDFFDKCNGVFEDEG